MISGNYTVLFRDCTVDNGDTTSDTEMGRETHCWMGNQINFNEVDMHGCALACITDGCNTSPTVAPSKLSLGLLVILTLIIVRFSILLLSSDKNC